MFKNKINRYFFSEILRSFFIVLLSLSVIAWVARSVNFLDLIVEDGYSVNTYFFFSSLNLLGIITKFIPLSFLIALMIFILKEIQENEFLILWSSGLDKIKIVNLFILVSFGIIGVNLIFSNFISPNALNKSRNLLAKDGFNSFLNTIRVQKFNDSFKDFTFFVEKKNENKLFNIFINDSTNAINNLKIDSSANNTIIAKEGIVEKKMLRLIDGQLVSFGNKSELLDIISFEKLDLNLSNLITTTIKVPKLQETPTTDLIRCYFERDSNIRNCGVIGKNFEYYSTLNRRIFLPFYLPIISLVCSLLILKRKNNEKLLFNKFSIFSFNFLILVIAEILLRYSSLYFVFSILFIAFPIFLIPTLYIYINLRINNEGKFA